MSSIKNIKMIVICLISSLIFVSCKPYKNTEILFDYGELGCLYYTRDSYKEYKYSDFIVDDISNGEYKKATPNIADFKNGDGLFDYDIEGYVKAKMDFSIKEQLIKKYEYKVDDLCVSVHDDYYKQKKSYVYFYNKLDKRNTLLSKKIATNIMYDNEEPTIVFDVNPNDTDDIIDELKGRKIKLSDIIVSNMNLEGYMRVILGVGKEKHKFFMDREIFDVATFSEIITEK